MFNLACTQIIFKDYLEYHKMKVNKLQVSIDDLYHQFIKEISAKKSSKNKISSESSSKNQIIILSTIMQNTTVNTFNNNNNNSNSEEDNVEETGIINKKINNPVIENNVGAETKLKNSITRVNVNDVGVEKEQKTLQLVTENVTVLTKKIFINNSSSTLIENNIESSNISRHCKICNTAFQISRAILNDLPNPLNTFCNSFYLESINSPEVNKPSTKKVEKF